MSSPRHVSSNEGSLLAGLVSILFVVGLICILALLNSIVATMLFRHWLGREGATEAATWIVFLSFGFAVIELALYEWYSIATVNLIAPLRSTLKELLDSFGETLLMARLSAKVIPDSPDLRASWSQFQEVLERLDNQFVPGASLFDKVKALLLWTDVPVSKRLIGCFLLLASPRPKPLRLAPDVPVSKRAQFLLSLLREVDGLFVPVRELLTPFELYRLKRLGRLLNLYLKRRYGAIHNLFEVPPTKEEVGGGEIKGGEIKRDAARFEGGKEEEKQNS